MTYPTIDEVNITGFDDIFVYVGDTVPGFMPMMILFLWLTVTMTIYFGTRKFNGQADFFASASASGFFISVVGVLLSLTSGVIDNWSFALSLGIGLISVIMLLTKRNRD